MSDIVNSVSEARSRVDEASGRHARSQALADAATEDAQRILGVLSSEFGVSSASEAQALLASYESQITEQVRLIEDALAEAEGGAST